MNETVASPENGDGKDVAGVSGKAKARPQTRRASMTEEIGRLHERLDSLDSRISRPSTTINNTYYNTENNNTFNGNTINGQAGSVGDHAAINIGRGSAAPQDDAISATEALTVEEIFASLTDPRDGAFFAAAGFLDGAPYDCVLDAAGRLAELIIKPETAVKSETAPIPGPFASSRTVRLRRIGAKILADETNAPFSVERIGFDDPERAPAVRRFVWKELGDMRLIVCRWLDDLARSGTATLAAFGGIGVGACAEFDLAWTLTQIQGWALSEGTGFAAGHALRTAAESHAVANDKAMEFLKMWTGNEGSDRERGGAVMLCNSVWGLTRPKDALLIVSRILRDDNFETWGAIQATADLFWQQASFFPDDYRDEQITAALAEALAEWLNEDADTLGYYTPLLIAHAIGGEIFEQNRRQSQAVPMVLRDNETEETRTRIFKVLNQGLRKPVLRPAVRAVLDALAARVKKLGTTESAKAFRRFITEMSQQGDEDDRARLGGYADRWAFAHSIDIFSEGSLT